MLGFYTDRGETIFAVVDENSKRYRRLDSNARRTLCDAIERNSLTENLLTYASHPDLIYVGIVAKNLGYPKTLHGVFEEILHRAGMGEAPPEDRPYSDYAGCLTAHAFMFSQEI